MIDPVRGDGSSVSIRMPLLAGTGTYYLTVMMSSGSMSGQTHYWSITANW